MSIRIPSLLQDDDDDDRPLPPRKFPPPPPPPPQAVLDDDDVPLPPSRPRKQPPPRTAVDDDDDVPLPSKRARVPDEDFSDAELLAPQPLTDGTGIDDAVRMLRKRIGDLDQYSGSDRHTDIVVNTRKTKFIADIAWGFYTHNRTWYRLELYKRVIERTPRVYVEQEMQYLADAVKRYEAARAAHAVDSWLPLLKQAPMQHVPEALLNTAARPYVTPRLTAEGPCVRARADADALLAKAKARMGVNPPDCAWDTTLSPSQTHSFTEAHGLRLSTRYALAHSARIVFNTLLFALADWHFLYGSPGNNKSLRREVTEALVIRAGGRVEPLVSV